MDLEKMRSLGVTKVDVYGECGHEAAVDVSNLPGDLAVPDVRPRLRCSKRGKRPAETRPRPVKLPASRQTVAGVLPAMIEVVEYIAMVFVLVVIIKYSIEFFKSMWL
jgi:hypothetical protein